VIRDELGAGGMAVVYRADDVTLRREVAIKVLAPHLLRHPDTVARFLREARAAGGLEHPHVLKIFDVGDADEGAGTPPYMVMELIRGRSLKAFLDERGAPLAEVVAMLGAILADALDAAHRAGIVHRDVKPANVMITDDGRPILCDFGVARMDDDALATQTGMVLGTPTYMSPEQALAQKVDARSDVYSLGATLYHAATGTLPFMGTTAGVISAVTRGDFAPPLRRNPAMGAALAREIARAMAKDPGERHASAAALGEALAAIGRVPGLGERADELRAYFAEPGAWNERAKPVIVAAALQRAEQAAAARQVARALAEADRVLALEPAHEGAAALVERVAHGARRRRRLAIAAASVGGLALLGAGGAWVLGGDGGRVAATVVADAASPEPDATVAAATSADAAVAIVAATPPDAAPVAGGRPPRRVADAGVALVTLAPDAAPAPPLFAARPDAGPAVAWLDVHITPWCALTVDGVDHGRVQGKRRLELAPGKHRLVCTGGGGTVVTRDVDLAAGATDVWKDSVLATIAVTVQARADVVRIDGVRYRKGDVARVGQGQHRVELLENEKVVDQKYLPITVACTLRDTPLRCDE
jgi:serine/threonine-protein kinase